VRKFLATKPAGVRDPVPSPPSSTRNAADDLRERAVSADGNFEIFPPGVRSYLVSGGGPLCRVPGVSIADRSSTARRSRMLFSPPPPRWLWLVWPLALFLWSPPEIALTLFFVIERVVSPEGRANRPRACLLLRGAAGDGRMPRATRSWQPWIGAEPSSLYGAAARHGRRAGAALLGACIKDLPACPPCRWHSPPLSSMVRTAAMVRRLR
jgi:hypothetical protein